MAFCTHCGSNVNNNAVVCIKCGCSMKNNHNPHNCSSALYAILGFLFPLIGIFAFFIMLGDRPKTAKSAIQGVILNFILTAIAVVAFFLYVNSLETTYIIN